MVCRYKGPLRAYRIADGRHPIFDGSGAALMGGRWNSPGQRVIYGSSSFACAMLEKLAQTGTGSIPKHQLWIEIHSLDDIEIEEVSAAELPRWASPDLLASRAYGDAWLVEKRTAVLAVPSVVAPQERNILINQSHADFKTIMASEPKPVRLDRRLFQK